jgi:hypothetical protein
MSRPASLLRNIGSKAAINACCARKLRVMTSESSFASILSTGVRVPSIAALRTRISNDCQRSETAPTSRMMLSPSTRSSGAIVALPPAVWMASSTSSSAAAVRAVRITCAPWLASAFAVAAPIPRLAPVTIASFPSSDFRVI